jgi:hypothetical protein
MSLIDKDICKALDRIHVEAAGLRKPCRWSYDAGTDTYSCQHVSVLGSQVVREINPEFWL